jgi:hypothetical protein
VIFPVGSFQVFLRGAIMKISIDVDCTADEARQFLGLPDVKPLQEAMMAEVRERLLANMRSMDPDVLMRQWMPGGVNGMDQLQRAFWNVMTTGAARKGEEQS